VPQPKKKDGKQQEEEEDEEDSTPSQLRSRVTITAPNNARVWVDNVACPVRSFDTPLLDTNRKYVYNFRMEVVRDGERVVENQRAVIVPGEPVNVNFNSGVVAASR
jgi:uncharacterized protein (TIGR03000 family)